MISSSTNIAQDVDKASRLMKKAHENTKSSIMSFRFKPDYDQVARYAKDAAVLLRRCGDKYTHLLIEALELSGSANESMNMFNTSGVDFDEAGDNYAKMGKFPQAMEKYSYCSRMYRLNGQPDKAAQVLIKAAKVADKSGDKARCMMMMEEACCVYEDEDRPINAEATFKTALSYIIGMNNLKGAVDLIHRQNSLYARKLDMFESDLHKNYLSEVVLLCSLKRYEDARAQLTKYELLHNFGGTDAFAAADALLDALSRDQATLDAVRKKHNVLKYVDNSVSRIAHKLEPDTKAKMASNSRWVEEEPQEVDEEAIQAETDDIMSSLK